MPDITIRPFELHDRESVFRLAADTAFFGEPLEAYLDDRRLFCDSLYRLLHGRRAATRLGRLCERRSGRISDGVCGFHSSTSSMDEEDLSDARSWAAAGPIQGWNSDLALSLSPCKSSLVRWSSRRCAKVSSSLACQYPC